MHRSWNLNIGVKTLNIGVKRFKIVFSHLKRQTIRLVFKKKKLWNDYSVICIYIPNFTNEDVKFATDTLNLVSLTPSITRSEQTFSKLYKYKYAHVMSHFPLGPRKSKFLKVRFKITFSIKITKSSGCHCWLFLPRFTLSVPDSSSVALSHSKKKHK